MSHPSYWLRNPHGVVSAVTLEVYNKRIKEHGWSQAQPENVPEVKQYPAGGELTEEGEKRRKHNQERANQRARKVDVKLETAEKGPELTADDLFIAEAERAASEAEILTKEQYRAISFNSLKKYAMIRGIHGRDLRREDILEKLDNSLE